MEQQSQQRAGKRSARPAGGRGLSLRTKITIAMLALALAPLGIVGGLVFNRTDQVVLKQVSADSETTVHERARQAGDEIARLRQTSLSLAAAQAIRFRGADMTQRENALLSAQGTVSNSVNHIILLDPSGTILVSAPRLSLLYRLDLPETTRNGEPSARVGLDENGRPQYQAFAPIMTQGTLRMALVVQAEFRGLLGSSEAPRAADGAALTLVDRAGKVVYSTQNGWESAFKEAVISAPQVEAALGGRTTSDWSKGTALGDVFLAAAPVPNPIPTAPPDWVVVYTIPSAAVLNAAADLRAGLVRDLLLVTAILALVVLAASVLFSRQLVAPVLAICRVMGRVRDGDFGARAAARGNDELTTLGRDLNQTLDSLVALIQTREERDELQRGIRQLLDEVSEVASGDLTVQADVTAGPTGAIADSFNYMIEELRGLVQRTQATADQVSTEATGVTSLTDRLVTSATEQRRRLEEARSSVSEMTGLMAAVRTTVEDSVTATTEAREAVVAGQQAVGETMSAIGRLRGETRETAMKIKRLGESSQEIGEIIRLINEIADQTHLLALNASIQAAMAGEHGRGFAVVAEEVRALAERSAAATSKIEELIRVIQADSNAAMVAMERSTQEVVAGSRLADRAGGALTAIGEVTERIVELSGQIEGLVGRQVAAAQALEVTVLEVADSTGQATSHAREVAEGMQALTRLSASLRESVSVFRVETEAEAPATDGESDETATPVAA